MVIKALRKAVDLICTGALFIVVGIILQLGKLTDIWDPGLIIGKYWPIIIIFFGVKYLVMSLVSVSVLPPNFDYKDEEAAILFYGHYPVTGIVWGLGLVIVGIILLFRLHEDFSIWQLFNDYWPSLVIIAGINGLFKGIYIFFRYFRFIREHTVS